jgi:hypothetical protein
MELVEIVITSEMIESAKLIEETVRVRRTQNSLLDSLVGIIGEYVFAHYMTGNYENNSILDNKGKPDFGDIEVKTSAHPFRENLNLLVREDYAEKRKPAKYVQIIIDIEHKQITDIEPGTIAYICGFATSHQIDSAKKKDFGSKLAGRKMGGYKCYYIPLKKLTPMSEF